MTAVIRHIELRRADFLVRTSALSFPARRRLLSAPRRDRFSGLGSAGVAAAIALLVGCLMLAGVPGR